MRLTFSVATATFLLATVVAGAAIVLQDFPGMTEEAQIPAGKGIAPNLSTAITEDAFSPDLALWSPLAITGGNAPDVFAFDSTPFGSVVVGSIPEPSTIGFLALSGLGSLLFFRHQRRNR